MVRQAGRTATSRTQSPLRISGASQGAALLTAPDGIDDDDPRFTSGLRLTPAFGIQIGHRRSTHEIPAFGTREHLALMSGSLDLDAIERAAQTGPLVGFAPIVLDPRGPQGDDPGTPEHPAEPGGEGLPASATRVLPSRRSLRAGAAPAGASASSLGRPLADGVLGGSVPGPRLRPVVSLFGSSPLATRAPATGALCVQDVENALASRPPRYVTDDPTPTGELARPFVNESAVSDWSDLEDVPPPVSVDVFQRAVRAGLALDDPEGLKALDRAADVGSTTSRRAARSRREVRARERALTSTRSVTARRLAKGGVLAITALGVVSGATPQGLEAFGISKDSAASRNTIDFATALAPDVSAPVLTETQLDRLGQTTLAGHLQGELAEAQVADVVHAGIQAGGAMAELAKEQDQRVLAEREAARQRAIRDVINNPQAYAKMLAAERGWNSTQFQCLVSLWNRESHWNYRAQNASSGAYGIAQALPGSKMNTVGADWRTNPVTQIKWGLNYISERYGTPCGAWSHSQATGWY